MKKLSLLFAFIGFFALTNVSAQSAKCCVLPGGTCILCPEGATTCDAKAVKTCTAKEVASCQKVAAKSTCNKSATVTATAITVANKSVEKAEGATCCGLPISCCSKTTGTATQTANTKMACNKSAEKSCGKAKATSTGQLAEKMN